jgi:hypothetical protein
MSWARSSGSTIAALALIGLAGCGGGSSLASHSTSTAGAGVQAAANVGAGSSARSTSGGAGAAAGTSGGSVGGSSHTTGGKRSNGHGSSGSRSTSRSASTKSTGKSGGAVGGFGSSSSKAAGAGPAKALAPSSPFIRAADAICSQYRQNVAPLGKATSLTATEQIRTTLINDARQAVTQLQGLSPPAADASTYQQFTSLTSSAITAFASAQTQSTSTVEATGVAVEQQDMARYETAINDAQSADANAHKLGFQVCGSPGSDWL